MSSGADGGPTSLLHMAGLSQGQPGSQQGTCARSLRTGTSEVWKPPSLDLHIYPDQQKLLPCDVVMIPEDINAAQPACRVPGAFLQQQQYSLRGKRGRREQTPGTEPCFPSSLSRHPPSLTWSALSRHKTGTCAEESHQPG